MWLEDKLKKLKKAVNLAPDRKEAILQSLLKKMDAADGLLRADTLPRRIEQRSIFYAIKRMPAFAVIALIALLGGGTSFAAQGSLPGDVLYPVKIGVNEKVAGSFMLNETARANWEAYLAEVRLTEAQKLALENRLSAELAARLEDNFEKFAERVENRIEKLESKDIRVAADLASRFEAALKAHQAIIMSLKSTTTVDVDDEAAKVKKIRERIEDEIESRGESGPEVKAAAEGKIGAASSSIASAQAYIELKSNRLSTSTLAAANTKLTESKNLLAAAQTKLNAGAYAEAFITAQKALRTSKEAKFMAETNLEFKLELRLNSQDNDDNRSTSSKSGRDDDDEEDEDEDEDSTSSIRIRSNGKIDLDL